MNVLSRLATVFVAFAAVVVGGVAPAGAQDAQPPAAPAAPRPAAPPAMSTQPAYPPRSAYPPPGYESPYGPPPPYAPPPGYGPPVYNPGAAENVHDGLFLRLHVGAGYTSVSATPRYSGQTKFSGGSLNLGLALGGAVAENLIVFGNLFLAAVDRPDSTQMGGPSSSLDGSAFLGGFGLGLAYYIMPANVYLSAALAAMSFSASDDYGRTLYASNAGVGFQGMIGKEWWVSSEWGLGLAGEMVFASMKDRDDSSTTWGGSSFSILFSSTFN